MRATAGTYFSFCGVDGVAGPWHEDALRVMTPLLSELFMNLMVSPALPASDSLSSTSPRQAAIVRLVAEGYDNKTIATKLSISEKTVRNQLTLLFARFGVRRRTQLIERLR